MAPKRQKPKISPDEQAAVVDTAVSLLQRVPESWGRLPELSHTEQKALGLLVVGGLVVRRLSLRLRLPGDERAVETRIVFCGSVGLPEAIGPAVREAWALWAGALKSGKKAYVEVDGGAGDWRLTDQGALAAKYAVAGDPDDVRYLRDFLRTPGHPDAARMPPELRFVPGAIRLPVRGEGSVERVEVVKLPDKSLSVRVENLDELGAPLSDIRDFTRGTAATLGQKLTDSTCREDHAPKDLVDSARAVELFCTSRSTLRRHIKEGKLKSYRKADRGKNAKHLFSKKDLSSLYHPRKSS